MAGTMEVQTELKSIKAFAEYLHNLRAVNLYIYVLYEYDFVSNGLPTLSLKSNEIEIPQLGNFKLILDGLSIHDCSNQTPRTLDNNVICYRLIVKPEVGCGSATAEIISNFEKTVDEGAKNLVKNSINNVALKEGARYKVRCRFCTKYLSNTLKFDRIRPLPSKDWVENAHELWYCHPPEPCQAEDQDVSARLDSMSLSRDGSLEQGRSVIELLKCPGENFCFYGPCNWAVNKDIVQGIKRNILTVDNSIQVPRAKCSFCENELGSFTSEFCVKVWDYGVEWVEDGKDESTSAAESLRNDTSLRAAQNFKSIVFATIYELSDNPTFRFTVSSRSKGDSVFLWNIDRNLKVFEQQSIQLVSSSDEKHRVFLKSRKVAKFFFAVKQNNKFKIEDPKELVIIQESEENEQSILTVPDYVYKAGVNSLISSSELYSRGDKSLQCGYLIYDV